MAKRRAAARRGREFAPALTWLAWLLARHPRAPDLLERAAFVQLALGDTRAAAASFERAAAAAAEAAGLGDARPGSGLGPPHADSLAGVVAKLSAGAPGAAATGARPDAEPGADAGPAEARVEGGAAAVAQLERLARRGRGLQLFAEGEYKGAPPYSCPAYLKVAASTCRPACTRGVESPGLQRQSACRLCDLCRRGSQAISCPRGQSRMRA